MPAFSLQLTNPRHDILVLHRVLPLRETVDSQATVLWLPVYALLHRDHRTQEPLIVYLPFDRRTGHMVTHRTDDRRDTLSVRFNHGSTTQHRPHGYPGTNAPTEETWSVAHLSLSETKDLATMERQVQRRLLQRRVFRVHAMWERLRGLLR